MHRFGLQVADARQFRNKWMTRLSKLSQSNESVQGYRRNSVDEQTATAEARSVTPAGVLDVC